MARFAGVKDSHICMISSEKQTFSNSYKVVEVSAILENVSSNDLILNYKEKNGQLYSKAGNKNASELKIAFVSNYQMMCGISTYAENLFPEIAKLVGDFKLFIEENDLPTKDIHSFGDQILSNDKISISWKRNESLQKLANEIKEYDPDIILINHEWGIFPNARFFLAFMTQLSDYRVITIMHSIFPQHLDKIIVERSMPEIIAHLSGGKKALEDKGINSKISVIGHGCYPATNQKKLHNLYKSEHTFIQAGFGLRYKAFEDCIKATSILKKKYSDVFFTALFSETPTGKTEHEFYYRELIKLVDELGLQDNVAIIRGFQSDLALDAYLRTNRVAVFPYKSDQNHIVYGASGAARLAFSRNVPVISSRIPHFSDLPTAKADFPEEIAAHLDVFFSDWKSIQKQLILQNEFIKENDWQKTAQKYLNVFLNKII